MRRIPLFLIPLALSCSVEDAQICKYKDGREAAVSLTFDDGILDHYTLVAPKLDYNGHEISSHAWFYKNFSRIREDEIREEVQKNDEIIGKELGRKPVTFCFPFNAITEKAANNAG